MATIQLIVEGHGDAKALPVLVRRILHEKFQKHTVGIQTFKQPRGQLVKQDGLERAINTVKKRSCDAILVLIDADDSCPMEEPFPSLVSHGKKVAGNIAFFLVLANREYEAWFLASLDMLKGRNGINRLATFTGDPELIRDAKGKISGYMPRNAPYSETLHQEKLSAIIDIDLAHRRSRSFRKLYGDLQEISTLCK